MAKDKKKQEWNDCKICNSSITLDDILYCKLKYKDYPIKIAIVDKVFGCSYYKEKIKNVK